MSEEFFTRADWRKGKRRGTYVRVKPYGGAKHANAHFLAAGRAHAIGSALDARARCAGKRRDGAPCGGLALRGSTFCLRHGGAQGAKRFRPYVPVWASRRASAPRASASAPNERKHV